MRFGGGVGGLSEVFKDTVCLVITEKCDQGKKMGVVRMFLVMHHTKCTSERTNIQYQKRF